MIFNCTINDYCNSIVFLLLQLCPHIRSSEIHMQPLPRRQSWPVLPSFDLRSDLRSIPVATWSACRAAKSSPNAYSWTRRMSSVLKCCSSVVGPCFPCCQKHISSNAGIRHHVYVLENISVPPWFISKASSRIDLCIGAQAVFVCDGGTDHNISATPPLIKVSYYYIKSFTTLWYEY